MTPLNDQIIDILRRAKGPLTFREIQEQCTIWESPKRQPTHAELSPILLGLARKAIVKSRRMTDGQGFPVVKFELTPKHRAM